MSQASSVAPVLPQPSSRASSRIRPGRLVSRAALYLVVIAFALFMAQPFVWMVLSSLKSHADISSYPPKLWPTEWVWSNSPSES